MLIWVQSQKVRYFEFIHYIEVLLNDKTLKLFYGSSSYPILSTQHYSNCSLHRILFVVDSLAFCQQHGWQHHFLLQLQLCTCRVFHPVCVCQPRNAERWCGVSRERPRSVLSTQMLYSRQMLLYPIAGVAWNELELFASSALLLSGKAFLCWREQRRELLKATEVRKGSFEDFPRLSPSMWRRKVMPF